jgi:hypothetical protein
LIDNAIAVIRHRPLRVYSVEILLNGAAFSRS